MDVTIAELFRSAVLGLVQGLTEFLPISSSAHLILFPRLLGWPDQGLAFDIAANTGTLAALVAYFRRDLVAMVPLPRGPGRGGGGGRNGTGAASGGLPLWLWLGLATIPVGVFGLVARDWVAGDGRNPLVIATTTLVFGVLLWLADVFTDRLQARSAAGGGDLRDDRAPTWIDALVLGVAQAVSLVPGTSRSGAVMTAGLFRAFDREGAARLAFLMALPVGFLVAANDLWGLLGSSAPVPWAALIVGFVTSAISGYAVIALLLEWLRRRSLKVFVAYRLVLGVVLLWVFL